MFLRMLTFDSHQVAVRTSTVRRLVRRTAESAHVPLDHPNVFWIHPQRRQTYATSLVPDG